MEYNYEYSGNVAPEVGAGMFAGVMLFQLLFVLAFYVYFAYCLMKIAHKTNTPNAWLAWIPIGNVVLMLQIAKKPVWWIILMIIPFVNLVWIILGVIVWMKIAKAVGKPEWLGILSLIPIANIILPGYLAFSKSDTPAAPATPTPPASV